MMNEKYDRVNVMQATVESTVSVFHADVGDWPSCKHCGKVFTPGSSWSKAQLCRAEFLLDYVDGHPGLSVAELAQAVLMPYLLAVSGMSKARSLGLVGYTAELRNGEEEDSGFRYRYTALPKWRERLLVIRTGKHKKAGDEKKKKKKKGRPKKAKMSKKGGTSDDL